ncbi:MAG: molybdenum cofactor biosynthesis protein MoaE [Actinomycetaceae bacterium]|nr:molybdenum cofactor biosynthesis protein MoaE [Actinomycetaceae bacterium]
MPQHFAGPPRAAPPKIAVITVSDRCARGLSEDVSGPLAAGLLGEFGDVGGVVLAPDSIDAIRRVILGAIEGGARVVLTTGGTGVTSRDVTPEATAGLVTQRMPGIENLVRDNPRVPGAAISRGVAGVVTHRGARAFVVNAPGSPGGVRDAVGAVGPRIAHIVDQLDDGDHPEDERDESTACNASAVRGESPLRQAEAADDAGGASAEHDESTSRAGSAAHAAPADGERWPVPPDSTPFGQSAHEAATWRVQNRGRSDGSDAAVALASVVAEPIDMGTLAELVDDSSTGAVVTFRGQVRDHDEARHVTAIEYEAHPQAGEVIREVAEAAGRGSGACKIALAHRSGRLEVGDIALGAAVSASHRAEALRVLDDLIEAVKMRLPVWKKQIFADGTSQWTGRA